MGFPKVHGTKKLVLLDEYASPLPVLISVEPMPVAVAALPHPKPLLLLAEALMAPMTAAEEISIPVELKAHPQE